MADIEKRGKTDLRNLNEVKAVFFTYVESCRRSDTLPTFEGLCVSLGRSRQYVYKLLQVCGASDPVADFLNEARTFFADLMQTASLKRYTDCATTIFCLKNSHGLGYSDHGDAPPEENTKLENENRDEYLRKYGHLIEE